MRELSIEEYKTRVLNVLVKIDEICRENGFKYFIFYGTLLGAVRHKGFIPWDDDIDIVMFRDDYYKLADYIIAHPELGLNYIDIYNRDDTIYYCAKVCDAETIVKESSFVTIDGYGAFVDIFPLDYLEEDESKRKKVLKRELFWEKVHQHASMQRRKNAGFLKSAADWFSHFFDASKIIRKMHERYMENDKTPTRYMGLPFDKSVYDVEWLKESVDLEFDGHKFIAPKEYDTVLTATYGDYMKLPPEEDRVYKHSLDCYLKD